MRCHQHTHVEAIAVCVSCGRALCRDCCRSGVDGCIVCSAQCEGLAAKQMALRLATAEYYSVQAAQFHSLAKVMTMAEIVSATAALGVLIWEYVLPASNVRVALLEPVEAIGFASIFAMLGVVLWYAARIVRGIGNRFAQINSQLR